MKCRFRPCKLESEDPLSKTKWTTREKVTCAFGVVLVGVAIFTVMFSVGSPQQVAVWEAALQAERAEAIRHIDETGEWPLDGPRPMLVDESDPYLMKILLDIELRDRHGDGPGVTSLPMTRQLVIWMALGVGLALIFIPFFRIYRARTATKPPAR